MIASLPGYSSFLAGENKSYRIYEIYMYIYEYRKIRLLLLVSGFVSPFFLFFFFFGRIQLYVLWIVLKGSIILKNRHFITQERFDKLIYGINTIMIYGIYTIIKCDIL